MRRYTRAEIEEIMTRPTLWSSQDADLKIVEGGVRVWVARGASDDEAPLVEVEEWDPNAGSPGLPGHATPPSWGAWRTADRYVPEGPSRDDEEITVEWTELRRYRAVLTPSEAGMPWAVFTPGPVQPGAHDHLIGLEETGDAELIETTDVTVTRGA